MSIDDIPLFENIMYNKWCVAACPVVENYRGIKGESVHSPYYPFGINEEHLPVRVRCFVDTMSTSASAPNVIYPTDTPTVLIITSLPDTEKLALLSAMRGYIITVYPTKDANEGITYNGSGRPVIYSQHIEFLCNYR